MLECESGAIRTLVRSYCLAPKLWFLIPFSNRRSWDSVKKSLSLGLGQDIYKISLNHFIVSDRKNVLKRKHTHTHNGGGMPKRTGAT